MPDLRDGESLQVQGSAPRPYILKNVAGVYSCSCAGWRFQSLPIEKRTCRHLRNLRGDSAEEARIGTDLPTSTRAKKPPVKAPPLLLAQRWDPGCDPTSYLMSEKLDGVRAYWDGKQFLSRQGNRYFAPAWFTAGLPLEPLDGELWIGRKKFQRTVSIVRRHDQPDSWREVRFQVFDAPAHEGRFESRLELVRLIMDMHRPPFAAAHPHQVCQGLPHLHQELAHIEAQGGEGLMLRQPGSRYEAGRSATLLKVKTFQDAEARVIGHEAGSGRHKGRLGALLVQLADGTRFAVGTGFSDAERENPPPIGSTITVRYQELSDGGVPRFPTFVRVRQDIAVPSLFVKGETNMPASAPRRFECVSGGSDKFWWISVDGTEVTVHFGRNGASGQIETKSFPDAIAAQKYVQKKIDEKLKKGYVEIG